MYFYISTIAYGTLLEWNSILYEIDSCQWQFVVRICHIQTFSVLTIAILEIEQLYLFIKLLNNDLFNYLGKHTASYNTHISYLLMIGTWANKVSTQSCKYLMEVKNK